MVGYGPPIFRGKPGDDPEDFIRDFQRYVVANRINTTPGAGGVAGRAEADGLFEFWDGWRIILQDGELFRQIVVNFVTFDGINRIDGLTKCD